MDDRYFVHKVKLCKRINTVNFLKMNIFLHKIVLTVSYIALIGAPMTFSNFVKDEPKGNPYLHMNFDAGFAWDTKDDANDQDNGFICKKQHTA